MSEWETLEGERVGGGIITKWNERLGRIIYGSALIIFTRERVYLLLLS